MEDTGAEVSGWKAGDLVVAPFVWSDGTCDFCREGLQTSCRHGGLWARNNVPLDLAAQMRNITLTGGAAPARAYIGELLLGVLDGNVEPGQVFDTTVRLEDMPDGYRAMADRKALKVLIQP